MKTRQDSTSLIPRHTDVPEKAQGPHGSGHSLSQDCSRVGEVLSRIGDKWTVMVVMVLRDGPKRFNELKREIGGVSQRMLTLTLRGLERDGLVTRTVFATVPPRVDYELTALGQSLRVPIEALGAWTFAHLDVLDAARRNFDKRNNEAVAAPRPLGSLLHVVSRR